MVLTTVLAFACLVLRVPGCTDMDDEMMELTRQQIGQPVTCAQVVSEKVCLDPQLSQHLCCYSCSLLQQQYAAERDMVLEKLQERARHVKSALGGRLGNVRFQSPPLHGRGTGMPLITLGTAGFRGERGIDTLVFAIEIGYRHLDTAIMYANHGEVSEAVKKSGVKREDVFITSKIPPTMMGFQQAVGAVELIKKELPGSYADLCLIHWPSPEFTEDGRYPGQFQTPEWIVVERAGTWRALEQAFDSGVCRAIGVSNFMVKHLEELERYAKVPPAVNQLEHSPIAPLQDLEVYCKKHGIVLQAFGWLRTEVLQEPAVREIAAEVGKPAAQVIALWYLQQGMVPLYKSSNVERVLDHVEAVIEGPELSESQLARIGNNRLSNYPWKYYRGALDAFKMPVMADVSGEIHASP